MTDFRQTPRASLSCIQTVLGREVFRLDGGFPAGPTMNSTMAGAIFSGSRARLRSAEGATTSLHSVILSGRSLRALRHLHRGRSRSHLDFAVRQGRTSPERYLGRLADLACHSAVARGDLVTAAIILGHRIAAVRAHRRSTTAGRRSRLASRPRRLRHALHKERGSVT